ncbi:MAG: LytR/AlgR family response regulator transcription factor [Bacteroidia bacterium]
MKALIIDDERLARQELKKLLEKYPEIEIIGECTNAVEALERIPVLNPELIFLDIQMPEMTGFQLLEKLDEVPKVIFVTAYDEYALKAFEYNALDYLLKPIQSERLDETIKKVINEKNLSNDKNSSQGNYLTVENQVFLKDGDKCWFVKLDDIRLFESEGNYVRVYFHNFKPLILKSLNNLEERLHPQQFFRASRKHIVNLKWIESVENWFNGGLMAKLKSGEQVEISRRQSAKFKDMMSL